jgi:hypothetical protein
MTIELSLDEAEEILSKAMTEKLGVPIIVTIDTDIPANIEITGRQGI